MINQTLCHASRNLGYYSQNSIQEAALINEKFYIRQPKAVRCLYLESDTLLPKFYMKEK